MYPFQLNVFVYVISYLKLFTVLTYIVIMLLYIVTLIRYKLNAVYGGTAVYELIIRYELTYYRIIGTVYSM
jgi:hypothetical protein